MDSTTDPLTFFPRIVVQQCLNLLMKFFFIIILIIKITTIFTTKQDQIRLHGLKKEFINFRLYSFKISRKKTNKKINKVVYFFPGKFFEWLMQNVPVILLIVCMNEFGYCKFY